MKKVLFVATVTKHINAFHIPYLKYFKENGYEVHVASRGDENIEYCDKHYNLQFERNPFKKNNLKTLGKLRKIIKINNYEILHCHTPVGGVLSRIAAKNVRKNGTKVIYTAHGFHFYKGAPILNKLIYYSLEKWLSRYTDCLITINQEDYELAKRKFKAKQIELVYGVGVDKNKFNFEMMEQEKEKLRNSLGLKKDNFVLIQIGELNKNKNQIMSINVMRDLVKENSNIHLLIVGRGSLEDFYKEKIKEYDLENNIHLLGYRTDISKLLKISNVLLSLSYREGLPVNVIEGMLNKIPIIATNCRGNRDLISDCIQIDSKEELKEKINYYINNYKQLNINYNTNKYLLENIINQFKEIYRKVIGEYL